MMNTNPNIKQEECAARARIRVVECVQNSPEWYQARCGLITASQLDKVLSTKRGDLTRSRYMRTLASELVTGVPGENFTTPAMERGHALQAEAEAAYAFVTDTEVSHVGFLINDHLALGCSPDGLLGSAGILEVKTKRGDIMVDVLLRDEVPAEHIPQCQGLCWIAEREWVDLVCYWPGMPLFMRKVPRDEHYINMLASEVERFKCELDEMVTRIQRYAGL
jgi:hypothetical protein